MSFKPWLIVFILLLWSGIAAQCGLAFHAFLVERREGMRSSNTRIYLLGGIFVLSSVLVLAAIFMPPQTAPATAAAIPIEPARTSSPEVESWQRELGEVNKQLEQIEQRRKPLVERIDKIQQAIANA